MVAGLFLTDAPAPVRLVENAVVGVIIAVASFVCSVGNLPLAACSGRAASASAA